MFLYLVNVLLYIYTSQRKFLVKLLGNKTEAKFQLDRDTDKILSNGGRGPIRQFKGS